MGSIKNFLKECALFSAKRESVLFSYRGPTAVDLWELGLLGITLHFLDAKVQDLSVAFGTDLYV